MQHIWVIAAAMLAACGTGEIYSGPEKTGDECEDVELTQLPMSAERLRSRVSELTGYEEGYTFDRICRADGIYLLGIIPPKDRRHGIFSVLLMMDEAGEISVVPSE